MSIIDDQWHFVLHHTDEHVRRIAERASRMPGLRELFPYPSLSNLRFSRKTEYPYDEMPYVLTVKSEPATYEARGPDNRKLAEGNLDVVIAAVWRAIESQ